MSENTEDKSKILDEMPEDIRVLFDAAVTTAWICGEEVGSMNQNAAELQKILSQEQWELLNQMRLRAFSTGKKVGILKAQGMTPEEISKQEGLPLKIIKEEEKTNGSGENE